MSSTIVVKPSIPTATAGNSAVTTSPSRAMGKNKNSAAAAAAKETSNQQTTYGCNHIKFLLDGVLELVSDSYQSALRLLADPNRLDAQTCNKCNEVITRTLLCLQCSNVACQKEAEVHSKAKNHMFAIDSKLASMYCFSCKDFIYDPFIEKTRIIRQADLLEGNIRKKRKIEELKPSLDDLKYIETNTSSAPCRATGLRGFYNLGATCFMSVVMQTLIHNPLIRNFYLSDGHRAKECTQTNCMSCAVEEVFAEFFTSDKVDGYCPVNLLVTSWKCEQAPVGYQQQDAHEYLQFLLNQLHTSNGGTADTKTDSCKCIIHRCYYGKLQSDVTCGNCHNVTTAVDPVMDLSLELKPKGKKGGNFQGNSNSNNTGGDENGPPGNGSGRSDGVSNGRAILTLQECLKRFTTPEKLGVNEYNCSKCSGGSLQEATKQLTVKRLPPVLCIQLKRFEHSSSGSSKIDTKVRFPTVLDMTPYTTRSNRKPPSLNNTSSMNTNTPTPPSNKKDKSFTPSTSGNSSSGTPPPTSHLYDLLTVVVHDGQINTGHYYSYSKVGGQWFRFNDSVVSVASETQVLAEKAYLLFYIVKSLNIS